MLDFFPQCFIAIVSDPDSAVFDGDDVGPYDRAVLPPVEPYIEGRDCRRKDQAHRNEKQLGQGGGAARQEDDEQE